MSIFPNSFEKSNAIKIAQSSTLSKTKIYNAQKSQLSKRQNIEGQKSNSFKSNSSKTETPSKEDCKRCIYLTNYLKVLKSQINYFQKQREDIQEQIEFLLQNFHLIIELANENITSFLNNKCRIMEEEKVIFQQKLLSRYRQKEKQLELANDKILIFEEIEKNKERTIIQLLKQNKSHIQEKKKLSKIIQEFMVKALKNNTNSNRIKKNDIEKNKSPKIYSNLTKSEQIYKNHRKENYDDADLNNLRQKLNKLKEQLKEDSDLIF